MTTGKQQQNEDLTTDYLKFNNILAGLELGRGDLSTGGDRSSPASKVQIAHAE